MIKISVCGLTSDIPHDETVKSYVLEKCPSAIVTVRSVSNFNLLYTAYQEALNAGDDIMCDAWNYMSAYYPQFSLGYDSNFKNVIDSIVAAGKIAISASSYATSSVLLIPAHLICTGNSELTSSKQWLYGNSQTISWSLGQVAGIAGQLWTDYPAENNFDIMARLLGGSSNGLGNRIDAGGWGLARHAESNAITDLPLLPPMWPLAIKSEDNKNVTLTWHNMKQSQWRKTRIIRSDTGAIVYEGTKSSTIFYSDIIGDIVFKFYSVDSIGNLSADELYTQVEVTGLQIHYFPFLFPNESQMKYTHRSSFGVRKFN